jgi:di/tricarboxylate transporter
MVDQLIVAGVLVLTLVLFICNYWRYDVVALGALLTLCIAGVVPADEAFLGFGHPAVITVAAVLVVSRALQNSGAVDRIAAAMTVLGDRPTLQIAGLTVLVTFCSAFMNNVGALAILMPVAVHMARSAGRPPSMLLMPLAFGSLLGGLITLIGTPPNIIIATFRGDIGGEPFRMFDFAPVGAGVAAAGILFIVLGGWRLIPHRKGQASREELFHIEEYIAELRVKKDSKLIDQTIADVDRIVDEDILVAALVRGKRRMPAPARWETIRQDDILIVQADPDALQSLSEAAGLEVVGSYEYSDKDLRSKEVSILEAVVTPNSRAVGRTIRSLGLGRRYGLNVLAVARQGSSIRKRLSDLKPRAGDVVLIQVHDESLQEALDSLGWLPLAQRDLRIGQPKRILLAVGIFAAALLVTAVGWLPVQIALGSSALVLVLVGLVSVKDLYEQVDWPIIVLIGAMLPVGESLETSGAATAVADGLLRLSADGSPVLILTLTLICTMFLSDVVNNAAAVVLMAPIAVKIAHGFEVSSDPFLMAVALGGSCAFLTPIGHQSNTLVMGPGGYQFGDYWRLGLPLEAIIVAVGVPLILVVWPL